MAEHSTINGRERRKTDRGVLYCNSSLPRILELLGLQHLCVPFQVGKWCKVHLGVQKVAFSLSQECRLHRKLVYHWVCLSQGVVQIWPSVRFSWVRHGPCMNAGGLCLQWHVRLPSDHLGWPLHGIVHFLDGYKSDVPICYGMRCQPPFFYHPSSPVVCWFTFDFYRFSYVLHRLLSVCCMVNFFSSIVIFTLISLMNTFLLRRWLSVSSHDLIHHHSILFYNLLLNGLCAQYDTINTVSSCTCIPKLTMQYPPI